MSHAAQSDWWLTPELSVLLVLPWASPILCKVWLPCEYLARQCDMPPLVGKDSITVGEKVKRRKLGVTEMGVYRNPRRYRARTWDLFFILNNRGSSSKSWCRMVLYFKFIIEDLKDLLSHARTVATSLYAANGPYVPNVGPLEWTD